MDLVGGRYRLGAQLGIGGMGVVYEAKDVITGRSVAVKILRDAAASDQSAVQRFDREARATLTLHHPNVVQVTDIGGGDGELPYYVMERLHGRSLGELVREVGPLSQERVVRIALQVTSALVAAHAAGVIHRDIKPDNVFLCDTDLDEDLVKVLDFGVAKVAEKTDLTLAGWIVGTLAFMSPEQARGEALDGRADLYSVGACMYLALTGVKPFGKLAPHALLMSLFSAEPERIESLAPHVDPELAAIVRKVMSKERDRRFPDARALRDALTSLLLARTGNLQFDAAPYTVRMPRRSSSPPPPLPSPLLTPLPVASDRTTEPPARRGRPAFVRRAVTLGVLTLVAMASGIGFDLVARRYEAKSPAVALARPDPVVSIDAGRD